MNPDRAETRPAGTDPLAASPVPLLRCDGVGLTFGSGPNAVVAVRDVSCRIFPRTRAAVVGPSGSGKSTLLYLLAGFEMPTAGNIAGDLAAQPRSPGDIGMVFQGPSLIPALDVLENVGLPLVLAGAAADEARTAAAGALEELEIGWLGKKLPEELSGGQAQRAAAARVLAARPRLILADEPTGQLDHETGTRLIRALLRAADTLGAALLVTTHDPQVAVLLDETWHMYNGSLTDSVEQEQA